MRADANSDGTWVSWNPPARSTPPHRTALLLSTALADLRKAVVAGKAEQISAAYLTLKQAGGPMELGELLALAGDVLGETTLLRHRIEQIRLGDNRGEYHSHGHHGPKRPYNLRNRSTLSLIASAFADRRCFMCEDGTTLCEGCYGTGRREGGGKGSRESDGTCSTCRGVGIAPCRFCHGTGWADGETVPPELRPAVQKRHRRQVHHAFRRIVQSFHDVSRQDLQILSRPQKRDMACRLLRLRAQLSGLGTQPAGPHALRLRANLQTLAARVQQYLDLVKAEE